MRVGLSGATERFTGVGVLFRSHVGGQGTTRHRVEADQSADVAVLRAPLDGPIPAGSSPPNRSPVTPKLGSTVSFCSAIARGDEALRPREVPHVEDHLERQCRRSRSGVTAARTGSVKLQTARRGRHSVQQCPGGICSPLAPDELEGLDVRQFALAAQCHYVVSTIATGDPARLQQEQDKTASLLAAASGSRRLGVGRWTTSAEVRAPRTRLLGFRIRTSVTPAGRRNAPPGTVMVGHGA